MIKSHVRGTSPIILFAGLVLICGIITIAGYLWLNQNYDPNHRPDFTLLDLQGNTRNNSEWDGKVVVVNFWATWCPPCVKEIPLFIKLQEKYAERGLQFVGIAINDTYETVQSFVKKHGINYPILGGENSMTVTQDFGNRMAALPFTVVINRKGDIVLRHIGEMHQEKAERIILPLL